MISDSPNLVLINFHDVEAAGHRTPYTDYLRQIEKTDELVYRLWENIQSIPQYQDRTIMIVMADHGRHCPKVDYSNHGDQCACCRHIPFMIPGPGIKKGETKEGLKGITEDIAPTVAYAMGFEMPFAEGRVLNEIFESPPTVRRSREGIRTPKIASDGIALFAKYEENSFTSSGIQKKIHFERSVWEKELNLSDNEEGLYPIFFKSILLEDTIYCLYIGQHLTGGEFGHAEYPDDHRTLFLWKISTEGLDYTIIHVKEYTGVALYPNIMSLDEGLSIVFLEWNEDTWQVYMIKGDADGETFSEPVQLSNSEYGAWQPSAIAEVHSTNIVWTEYLEDGSEIVFSRVRGDEIIYQEVLPREGDYEMEPSITALNVLCDGVVAWVSGDPEEMVWRLRVQKVPISDLPASEGRAVFEPSSLVLGRDNDLTLSLSWTSVEDLDTGVDSIILPFPEETENFSVKKVTMDGSPPLDIDESVEDRMIVRFSSGLLTGSHELELSFSVDITEYEGDELNLIPLQENSEFSLPFEVTPETPLKIEGGGCGCVHYSDALILPFFIFIPIFLLLFPFQDRPSRSIKEL